MVAGNAGDRPTQVQDKSNEKEDQRKHDSGHKLLADSTDRTAGAQRKLGNAADSKRLETDNKLGHLSLVDTQKPHKSDNKRESSSTDFTKFTLPETVISNTHPKKGEGYYQPLQTAGKEILGKNLSDGETKALVSAARALRKEQGKSLVDLSTQDAILPKNGNELKIFMDNVGNSKFGKQALSKDGIAKFKNELAEKLEQTSDTSLPTKPQDGAAPEKATETLTQKKDAPQAVPPIDDPFDFSGGGKRDERSADEVKHQSETKPATNDKVPANDKVTPGDKASSGNNAPDVGVPARDNTEGIDKVTPGEKIPARESSDHSVDNVKPYDRIKPVDSTAHFVSINPAEASKLLDTAPGNTLPPIAEMFEQNALKQLGPEAKPSIYVSKDAHDKNLPAGASSYRTINDAIRHAQPGTVIQVLAGQYNEKIDLRGEAQSNITIQTDKQNPAVINGGGFRVGSGTHDVTIRNFEVKNFSGHASGIRVDGSNIHDITIAGNNVHDAQNAEGIAVYGRPGTPVSRVSIIGNRVHDLKLSQLESIPINGNVDGFKVIGNSGYKLNNLFIDVIGGEGKGGDKDQGRNGIIANNFADGVSTKHNSSYGDYSSAAIYSDGGKSLDISGNYVRNSDFGVEIGSEHKGLNSSNVNVHDNIFENSVTWLKLGYKGGVDNTTVKDNLVINNKVSDVERNGPVQESTVHVDGNISASDRHHISQIPGGLMSPSSDGALRPQKTVPSNDSVPAQARGIPPEVKPATDAVKKERNSVDTKPVHTKPGASKPGDSKPVDYKPGDYNPGDSKPVHSNPVRSKPGDSKPVDYNPGDYNPGNSKPVDTKPTTDQVQPKAPEQTLSPEELQKELEKPAAQQAPDVTPNTADLKALQLAGKLIKDAQKLEVSAKKDLQVAKADRNVADQNNKLAQQTFLGIGSGPYLQAAQQALQFAERREQNAEQKLKDAKANREKSAEQSKQVLEKALDKMIGAEFWRLAPGATKYGNKGCAIAVTKALQAMGAKLNTDLAVTGTANQMKEMGWKQVSLAEAEKSGQLFVAVNKETGSHIGLGIGHQVWENNSAKRRFISRDMSKSTLRHSGRAFIVPLS